jgi:antitoxin (DNA-binding transcriptional repressor) of toxin-antitoxin stability system
MLTYTLAQAKTQFSKVIEEAQGGSSVLITKHGHPAALITKPEIIPPAKSRGLVGCMKDEFANWVMPKDFDSMMQDEIIALFEGCDQ